MGSSTPQQTLSLRSQNFDWDAKILGLNTRGALIHIGERAKVYVGQNIGSVEVMFNEQPIAKIPSVLVRQTKPVESGALVGVWFEEDHQPSELAVCRTLHHLVVAPGTEAQIYAHHPISSSDVVRFQVERIDERGMRLKTSLRNRAIFPGMRFLSARAHLGHFADFEMGMTIQQVMISKDSSHIICEAQFTELSDFARQVLQGFLITNQRTSVSMPLHPESTPKTKRVSDRPLSEMVRYTQANSLQHYLDLQMLRWRCQTTESRAGTNKIMPDEMIDSVDMESQLLLGYIGQDLVSSARLRVNETDTFGKTLSMEIDRIFVLTQLRRTTVLEGVVRFAMDIFNKSNATNLLVTANGETHSTLKRMGFVHIEITGSQPLPSTSPHRNIEANQLLMVMERKQNTQIKRTSRLRRLYSWARLQEFMIDRNYVPMDYWQPTRQKIFRNIAAVVLRMTKLQQS
jgi:hypothetical protein